MQVYPTASYHWTQLPDCHGKPLGGRLLNCDEKGIIGQDIRDIIGRRNKQIIKDIEMFIHLRMPEPITILICLLAAENVIQLISMLCHFVAIMEKRRTCRRV